MTDVRESLMNIVGPENYLVEHQHIVPYVTDWSGNYKSNALAVVLPDSINKIQELMRFCNQHKIGIVPQGGNTCSTYGAVPIKDANQIVLSLQRLNKVREVDALNYTMTVEAGCLLKDVQAEAKKHLRLFPLSLPSENYCTIGGNLATNAGGTAVLKYGNTRDLVLGLEVVLPDGKLWNGLSKLRKDNAGYDLKDIFIGSEGTLGIITAAVLKLFPKTPNRQTALVTVPKLENAIELLAHMRDERGDAVSTFEFMLRPCVDLVMELQPKLKRNMTVAYEAAVLIEVASTRQDPGFTERFMATLLKAEQKKLINHMIVADDEAMGEQLWAIRNGVPLGLDRGEGKEATGVIKHDVSVPLTDIAKFIREATAAVLKLMPACRVMPFGHVGDGNIHFNILPPENMPAQEFLAHRQDINNLVYNLAVQMRGSFAAEHGVGLLKADRLAKFGNDIKLQMMKQIKRNFDPNSIMNPGKVFS